MVLLGTNGCMSTGVNPGPKSVGFGGEKPPINYENAFCQVVDEAGLKSMRAVHFNVIERDLSKDIAHAR